MVKVLWIFVILLSGVILVNSASSLTKPKDVSKIYDWQLLKTLIGLIGNIQKPRSDSTKTQKTLQQATTMGVLMGTIKTEEKMEKNLLSLILELFQTFQKMNNKDIRSKIKVIDETMERDKRAIQILNNALNLAMKSKTVDEYRNELNKIALENSVLKNADQINSKLKMESRDKLMKGFKLNVIKHMTYLRDSVGDTAGRTMKNFEMDKKEVLPIKEVEIDQKLSILPSLEDQFNQILIKNQFQIPEISIPIQYWPFTKLDFESFQRFRRQNDDKNQNQVTIDVDLGNGIEEDLEFENNPTPGNGGFAGLIASLSGGDEGSDVGALVGALSGLISNLFGPGGLDVESLLSNI